MGFDIVPEFEGGLVFGVFGLAHEVFGDFRQVSHLQGLEGFGDSFKVIVYIEALERAVFEPPAAIEPMPFFCCDLSLVGTVGAALPKGNAFHCEGAGVESFDIPGVSDGGIAEGNIFEIDIVGCLFVAFEQLMGAIGKFGSSVFIYARGKEKTDEPHEHIGAGDAVDAYPAGAHGNDFAVSGEHG